MQNMGFKVFFFLTRVVFLKIFLNITDILIQGLEGFIFRFLPNKTCVLKVKGTQFHSLGEYNNEI